MQQALQYLNYLIDVGGEFPDAVFQAAMKFKVSQEGLKAEYDVFTSTAGERTLRELNGQVERVELPEAVALAFQDMPARIHLTEIERIERVLLTFDALKWPSVIQRYKRLIIAHTQAAATKTRMEIAS